MEEIKLTPSAVEKEVTGWIEYLNEIVGVMSFTLALSALGTRHPSLFAGIAFVFVMVFHFPNFRKKARIMTSIRNKRKKDRTELESHVLKEIDTKLKYTKVFLMIFGYLFLFFVAISSWLSKSYPILNEYMR